MNKDDKYIIIKFIKFITNELNLNSPFRVKLTVNRDDDLKTYAYYNSNSGLIKVYCKNRGMADILRSIAHELIHHLQNQRGELDQPVPDIGGKIEDEANSLAGQLVKKFGYQNPELIIYNKSL